MMSRLARLLSNTFFLKDRQRELDNIAAKSEVRESTVNLNKWSVMDSKESKRPFLWKTLIAILDDLYEELGVPKQDHLSIKSHGQLGYVQAAARYLKTLLSTKTHLNIGELAPKISSFEWLANVHGIFNATLMNTDLLMQWHNVDRYAYIIFTICIYCK